MTIFIDSSVWFAAANLKDRHRQRAQEIIRSFSPRVTSNDVVVETWLLLNSRIHRHAAETFLERIRAGAAHVENTTPADLEAAWTIGQFSPIRRFRLSTAPVLP